MLVRLYFRAERESGHSVQSIVFSGRIAQSWPHPNQKFSVPSPESFRLLSVSYVSHNWTREEEEEEEEVTSQFPCSTPLSILLSPHPLPLGVLSSPSLKERERDESHLELQPRGPNAAPANTTETRTHRNIENTHRNTHSCLRAPNCCPVVAHEEEFVAHTSPFMHEGLLKHLGHCCLTKANLAPKRGREESLCFKDPSR